MTESHHTHSVNSPDPPSTLGVLHVRNCVGGHFTDSASGRRIDVVNPVDVSTVASMPMSDAADAADAVRAARRASAAWRETTVRERAELLLRLADRLEAERNDLAAWEARDAGKPVAAAEAEVPAAIDALRFYAGASRSVRGPASGEYVAGHTSLVRREPVGVCGLISPWNYPLLQTVHKIGPALATGNTVVHKPAETTPATAFRLAQLANEVLPQGVLNVIFGDGPSAGAPLAAHPDVAMVSLTGSMATGISIAQIAGASLKRTVLELGGNAPVVVCEDADLEAALPAIAAAAFYNAGQDCTAATRVIVAAEIYDDTVGRLAHLAADVAMGDTMDRKVTLGPLNSKRQYQRVKGLIDQRLDSSEIVAGGRVSNRPGYFLRPTVVVCHDPSDPLVTSEIFGPVLTIQRATSDEQAITMANDTHYGLAASAWTQNVGRAQRLSKQLNFGTVWVNNHMTVCAEMPFGGFGHSGYGKESGTEALDEYTRLKHIVIAP